MARAIFKNNATSLLRNDTAAASISVQVAVGDGAKFPVLDPDLGEYCMITLEDRRTGQLEICKCTSRVADVLAVTRGQEGTTAQDFAFGATVSNRLTAATMQLIQDNPAEFLFATDEEALAATDPTVMLNPVNLDYVLDSRFGYLEAEVEPNMFLGAPSGLNKSGGGAQVPSFRILAANDLPWISRGGGGARRRMVADILADGGASVAWGINKKNTLDNLTTISDLMDREQILLIDQSMIYLRSSLPLAVFNDKNIQSMLGSRGGVVTFVVTRNDVPLIDGSDAQRVRVGGYLSATYLEPAVAGTPAFKMANMIDCSFDGIDLRMAADGLECSGVSRGNSIRQLDIQDCSGNGVALIAGRDLTINRVNIARAGLVGFDVRSGWLGGLLVDSLLVRECQQEGVKYAAVSQQDVIRNWQVDSNGLVSSGTKDGVRVLTGARGLKVQSGAIGRGTGWRRANGAISVRALVLPGETLTVGPQTYTFVTAAPGALDIVIGGSTTTLIANIRDKLQADAVITAVADVVYGSATVTITHKTAGAAGNAYLLSTTASNVHARGTFHLTTRPAHNDTLTLNGTVITFKTSGAVALNNEVNLGTSTANFATLLRDFLQASTDPGLNAATYSYASSTYTIVHDTPGAIGNAYTLATSAPLAFTSMPATLSGGLDLSALNLTGAGTLTGGTGTQSQRYGLNIEGANVEGVIVDSDFRGNVTGDYNVVPVTPVDIHLTGIFTAGTKPKFSASFIAAIQDIP